MRDLFRLLSGRYLMGHKRRTILTVSGILIGVTLIMGVLLVNKALVVSYERSVTDLAGKSQMQVSLAGGLPESTLQAVASLAHVQSVVPVVSNGTVLARDDKRSVALAFGVDPVQDAKVRTYTVLEGRMLTASDERALVLTKALADSIGASLGDDVDLLSVNGATSYKIIGLLELSGPARVNMGQFVAMPLVQAQKEFGKEGRFDQLDVVLDSSGNFDGVKAQIDERFGDRARVGRPADRSRELEDQLASVRVMLLMSSFIALFAASFIIYTNVRAGVEQRRHELSILRALGMSPRQVVSLVLREGLLLGVAGSVLGIGMGIGFSRGMLPVIIEQALSIYNFQPSDMPITGVELGLAGAIGVGITLLASYLPARETMRIQPVEGLRAKDASVVPGSGSVRQTVAGLVLVAASLVLLVDSYRSEPLLPGGMVSYAVQFGAAFVALFGLAMTTPVLLRGASRLVAGVLEAVMGTPGRMAADNLVRSAAHGSAAVNSILISVAMMVAIGGLSYSARETAVKWAADSLRWDLWVLSSLAGTQARVTLTEEFGEELSRLKGVELVVPERFATVDLGDTRPALWSYDMPSVREVFNLVLEEGDEEEAWRAMERGGAVVISTPIAQRQGYKIGDELELKTPVGPQKFKVAAIAQEIVPAGVGTITMNRKDYVKYWDDRTLDSFAVRLRPGTSLDQVRDEILSRWKGKYDLQVMSVADMKVKTQQGMDGFWAMSNALVMMAILVACLAVFNAMTSSLVERTRELGMLKAIGASSRQISRMVLLETLLIGLVGGLVGAVAGLGLSWAFIGGLSRNLSTAAKPYVPTSTLIIAAAVVLLLIPFAGWLANRPLRRTRLVDALHYE